MGKTQKKIISIKESPYEMIRLQTIVDKDQYFDQVYHNMKTEGVAYYRDFEIRYEKIFGSGKKYMYATYDEEGLPIKYYSCVEHVADDTGYSRNSIHRMFLGGRLDKVELRTGEWLVKFKPPKEKKK